MGLLKEVEVCKYVREGGRLSMRRLKFVGKVREESEGERWSSGWTNFVHLRKTRELREGGRLSRTPSVVKLHS